MSARRNGLVMCNPKSVPIVTPANADNPSKTPTTVALAELPCSATIPDISISQMQTIGPPIPPQTIE